MTQIVNSFREQHQRRNPTRIGKPVRNCSPVTIYRPDAAGTLTAAKRITQLIYKSDGFAGRKRRNLSHPPRRSGITPAKRD